MQTTQRYQMALIALVLVLLIGGIVTLMICFNSINPGAADDPVVDSVMNGGYRLGEVVGGVLATLGVVGLIAWLFARASARG